MQLKSSLIEWREKEREQVWLRCLEERVLSKLGPGGGSLFGGGGTIGGVACGVEGFEICRCDFAQIEFGRTILDTSIVALVHVLEEIEHGILEVLLLYGGWHALRSSLHLSLDCALQSLAESQLAKLPNEAGWLALASVPDGRSLLVDLLFALGLLLGLEADGRGEDDEVEGGGEDSHFLFCLSEVSFLLY